MTLALVLSRSAIGAAALWLLSVPAWAQTTTFGVGGYPCNAGITVSGGGLTLTSSAVATDKFCLANVGKYIKDVYNSGAGLFYYTFTPSGTITSQSYGFSSGPSVPSSVNGVPGMSATSNIILGQSNDYSSGIGYYSTGSSSGALDWINNVLFTGMGHVSSGVTGAVVANLNTDAAEVWVTPDIATLSCNGSGGSGSTHPKWNGNCTNDPSIPGSGMPTAGGTGAIVYMQGSQFFPAVTLGANDSTTFDFADNATLDSYLPAGYLAWNDATGSACSFPCPLDTVTLNIANAPRYTNSATMTAGVASSHTVASRIIAGPGCTKTTWTPGSSCWLWQALNSGTTSSGGDPTSAWTCSTPAAHGGFYATSFPGASTQTDNGVTFACLVAVDYPSLRLAVIDTATSWAAGIGNCPTTASHGAGCYYVNESVRNAGNIYVNIQQNFTTPYLCVSAGVAPTGTGTTNDGTCVWAFVGTPTYASHSPPYWSQVNFTRGTGNITEMTYAHHTNVRFWGGGHEVPQYEPSSGEADPPSLGGHQGQIAAAPAFCMNGYNGYSGATVHSPQCTGTATIEDVGPAPGDGFADNMTSADPLQPNAAYGVKIYNGNSFYQPGGQGNGLTIYDWTIKLHGLIIQSVHGVGVDGLLSNEFTDVENINGMIIEAGGPAVMTMDGGTVVTNNLLMLDGGAPDGSVVYLGKYGGLFSYNTIVCAPGPTHSVAIDFNGLHPSIPPFDTGTNTPWIGNAIFGCTDPWAYGSGTSGWETMPMANNAANATDIPSSYTTGTVFPIAAFVATGGTSIGATFPGTTYNLSESANLANPTFGVSFDARIKNTSANLYGTGVSYSFNSNYDNGIYPNNGVFLPGPDIFNVNRPVSGRFDIGAAMFGVSSVTPGVGGGRSFFK